MTEAAMPIAEASTVNLTCFEVQGQLHAIEVEFVREIARIMEITPFPNAPRLIEGVVDLRGTVIPVVDLAKLLKRGSSTPDLDARIIVMDVDGLVFGLWVDAATDVLTLDANRLDDVPDLATHAGYDVVRHVVRRADGPPIMVLAVDRLVESIFRSELPETGATSEAG